MKHILVALFVMSFAHASFASQASAQGNGTQIECWELGVFLGGKGRIHVKVFNDGEGLQANVLQGLREQSFGTLEMSQLLVNVERKGEAYQGENFKLSPSPESNGTYHLSAITNDEKELSLDLKCQ